MAAEPFIVIQDLCHAFGAGDLKKEVLKQVRLDFYPGEIVIIMGPSGSGKTTLLTLAGALRSIQQGSVRINGIELKNARPVDIMKVRRQIGFIFQGHNLIASLTARENVQLALAVDPAATASSSRSLALEYLAKVGLEGFGRKKPDQLSGGQKQRVAIARALIRRPGIILADEPTAALDRQTGREIVDLLHQLAREEGVAILMVTHDNRILDVADRIITLEDGQFEETHRGMDRLREALAGLTGLFPGYAATVSLAGDDGEALEGLRLRFKELSDPLILQAAEFASRRMSPPLMVQARILEKQLHDLTLCEETISKVLNLMSAPSDEKFRGIAKTFFQPLEFLVITMAEAGENPTADGIEHLVRLTSDREPLMARLREKYFESAGLDEKGRQDFYELTDLLARAIYLIHQWAEALNSWAAA